MTGGSTCSADGCPPAVSPTVVGISQRVGEELLGDARGLEEPAVGEEPFEDHALAAQDIHSNALRSGGGRPPPRNPLRNPPQSCEMALTAPRPER